MKNFIMIAQLLAALYPVLMQTIKSIEEAMPAAGQGPAKLELLKATLGAAYSTMSDAKIKFEELWPTLQIVVSAMVSMFNTVGAFKKSQ